MSRWTRISTLATSKREKILEFVVEAGGDTLHPGRAPSACIHEEPRHPQGSLVLDVPRPTGFHAQVGAEKHDLFCIWRELRAACASAESIERETAKVVARQNVDAALILRQHIISIWDSETKVPDVAAKRIVETRAREDSLEPFGVANAVVMEHGGLPVLKLFGPRKDAASMREAGLRRISAELLRKRRELEEVALKERLSSFRSCL